MLAYQSKNILTYKYVIPPKNQSRVGELSIIYHEKKPNYLQNNPLNLFNYWINIQSRMYRQKC